MWECPDFFPLNNSSTVWLLKYSIGPGPDFNKPWGSPGPRDYYVTGTYNASTVTGFDVDPDQWASAAALDSSGALDDGSFYASKSFLHPQLGRVLYGWLPEERPVDGNGDPWGWAGCLSIPRLAVPYRGRDGSWRVRTPPVESVLAALRGSASPLLYRFDLVGGSTQELPGAVGAQLEMVALLDASRLAVGASCGLRVLVSGPYATAVVVQRGGGGAVRLVVDPSSCCAAGREVNYSASHSAYLVPDRLEEVELRLLLDGSVLEAFLEGGRRASSRRVYAEQVAAAGSQVHSSGPCGVRVSVSQLRAATIRPQPDI